MMKDLLHRDIKVGDTVAFTHPDFHLLLVGVVQALGGTHPGKMNVLYEGEPLIVPSGEVAHWREIIYLSPGNAIIIDEQEALLYRLRKDFT